MKLEEVVFYFSYAGGWSLYDTYHLPFGDFLRFYELLIKTKKEEQREINKRK